MDSPFSIHLQRSFYESLVSIVLDAELTNYRGVIPGLGHRFRSCLLFSEGLFGTIVGAETTEELEVTRRKDETSEGFKSGERATATG